MNIHPGLEHCLSFINCQLQPPTSMGHSGPRRRAVTISRQTGSGGHTVGQRLVELLQARAPKEARPWTLFDKNLVEKVLEDHSLPNRLARYMPEDRTSEISDTIDELFGLHPPSWMLVRQTADTILHLAELGNVILIGRGAGIITWKLDYVFHVRLVGSVTKRMLRLQEANNIGAKAAREMLAREDLGRRRFLKKYFDKDIDDPTLYHLVINTDAVPCDEAAWMIANAIIPAPVKA
jgi:hypothetical protein